jgi:hypothetical protein
MKKFKETIKKYKFQILFAFIGLLITIGSFWLYETNKNNVLLIIVLLIVCFLFGWFQMYVLYIKDREVDKLAAVIATIFASIIFLVIVFTLLILFYVAMIEQPFNISYVYYTFFLYPSFVVVIMIIMLLMLLLSGM